MTLLSQFTSYSFPLLGFIRLPEVNITVEDKAKVGLKPNASNTNYLKQLTWKGYQTRIASGRFTGFTEAEVKDRLKMEFAVFEKTGTTDYFLLLADIAQWCDVHNILRGCGRGSSAGSLAMAFLGITDINSLKHGLYFSRFLSEARLKPKIIDGITYVDGKMSPDVDSDFEYLRRPEVIRYIEDKYKGRTCKISTRLQLTGKTALKDVLKAYLEYDESQAKRVTDNIEVKFGNVEDLSEAFSKRHELKEWLTNSPRHKVALEIARGLESLTVARGQHPSGIFISYAPLDGNIPIELSKTKEIVTSYDMNVSATLASKVDILGIRTLDHVNEVCKLIGIDPHTIDVNHQSIYDYFARTDLYLGLFQVSEGMTKEALRKIQPRNIDELAAVVALSRPGALQYIDAFKDFVKKGTIKSVHPMLDEILKTTGGIILYQENITEVCVKLFGMTDIEADQVRYYVGKKLKEEMKKTEPILYEKGRERGVPESVIKYFWDTCNASADYLFVKAHAYSYAYLTATTTFLKANHAKEFIFGLFKMSQHEPDSQNVISAIIGEANKMGIRVLPPNLMKSQDDFAFEGNDIRFGLQHIKGIAGANLGKVSSFRREFSNKFEMFEFAKELGIPINVVETLILCGALDIAGFSRVKLAMEARAYNTMLDSQKKIVKAFASDYSYDLMDTIAGVKVKLDEKGKLILPPGPLETFRKKFKDHWDQYQHNRRNEDYTLYLAERGLLGFSYTATLYGLFSRKVEGLVPVNVAAAEPKGIEVSFAAFIDEVKSAVGRESKKEYIRFDLSDETGKVRAMINGADKKAAFLADNGGKLPEESSIVTIQGTSSGDGMIFITSITVQSNLLGSKASKVKEGI